MTRVESQPPTPRVQVDVGSYASVYVGCPDGGVKYTRRIRRERPSVDLDTFGCFWHFSVARVRPGQARVRRQQQLIIPLPPVVGIFIPPFSIVEWHLQPGTFDFVTYTADSALPAWMPSEPFAVAMDQAGPGPAGDLEVPDSAAGVFALLRRRSDRIAIGREEGGSALARRAKQAIAETYHTEVPVAEIAERLGSSHACMARVFKKCYGITPVAYRNGMRVMDAVSLLLTKEQSMAKTSEEVGFRDLSRFNKQFKRLIKTAPTGFRHQ